MLRNLSALWRDEAGFILSAELALILTIGVLMLIVGLHAVSKAVVQELNDVSSAVGTLNQSYAFKGSKKRGHAFKAGSAFIDSGDDCDCTEIAQVSPEPKFDNGNGPESGTGGGGHGWH